MCYFFWYRLLPSRLYETSFFSSTVCLTSVIINFSLAMLMCICSQDCLCVCRIILFSTQFPHKMFTVDVVWLFLFSVLILVVILFIRKRVDRVTRLTSNLFQLCKELFPLIIIIKRKKKRDIYMMFICSQQSTYLASWH